MLVAVLSLLAGCRQHPKATSRESLDFIKQVYTACNTKNAKRLSACEERLAELQAQEKISKVEIKSFQRVLGIASKGEWESAQLLALQFAKDQIR
jgi:hypothetical protein